MSTCAGINSTDPFSPSKFEPYQLTAMKEGAQLAYDFIHHQVRSKVHTIKPTTFYIPDSLPPDCVK